MITEGFGPNLSIEPEVKELYVNLSGANRILRGASVRSLDVVGASTQGLGTQASLETYTRRDVRKKVYHK